MKRFAPPFALALFLLTSANVAPAVAQPAGAAAKAKAKAKTKKKPASADAPAPPAAPADPLDPYGLGGAIDFGTTSKPSGPLDPYSPPSAAPKPLPPAAPKPLPPAAKSAPLDPYATPMPTPAPKSAPVDPYATPAPPPKSAPVDPYATPAPPPKSAPVDPYATTPPPAPDPYVVAPPPPPSREPSVASVPAPPEGAPPGHLDIAAVQGLLAVQDLDGWLLADVAGENSIARTLVAPVGMPTRRWFYLVPRSGLPTLLCHTSEVASFAALPGTHVTYSGYRDLDKALKALLKGKKTVAMEYSPRGALPSLSRIDAGTLELVRAAPVTVKSSEVLVQFVKATWGPQGRRTHYVAAHHLVELRKEAIAFIKDQLATGRPVTELDVQQRIQRGMQLRGLVGPPPVVAFGSHTADPNYVPTPERAATLRRGDVVILSLAGKVDGGVYAALSWCAVVERAVPADLASTFDAAAHARDEALALIRDRIKRRRSVQGWEVDRAARDFLVKAGLDAHALHRTGHSLDIDLQGSGTDLDDLEVKDQRNLVVGTGFTVGPGLYYEGDRGVRAEVSVYFGKDGLEVTTPAQDHIEPLIP